jgi:hypothetical protein
LTEEGEILADLSIVDSQGLAELAARDGRLALTLENFELAEVEANAVDNRLRCQLVARGLAARTLHGRGSTGQGRDARRCAADTN